MNYPAREGLQHVSHDAPEGLHHDPRSAQEKSQHTLFQNSVPDDPEHYAPAVAVMETREMSRICGLPRKWFWILVGVLAVVIVAGAVGGGVGGAMAGKTKTRPADSDEGQSSSSQLSTPTQTSSTVLSSSKDSLSLPSITTSSSSTASTTTSLSDSALSILGCPASNGSSYSPANSGSSTKYVFQKFCQQDLRSSSISSPPHDIQNMPMPNLNSCIDACTKHNADLGISQTDKEACVAVAFLVWISPWVRLENVCYLKKRPEGGVFISNPRSPRDIYASAVLEGVKIEDVPLS